MTTYNIGGNEYSYAYWGDIAETDDMVLVLPSGSSIMVYRLDPYEYWEDIFTSGIEVRPYKPSDFYEWDDIESEWVFSQTIFTPYLFEQIKYYRDERL